MKKVKYNQRKANEGNKDCYQACIKELEEERDMPSVFQRRNQDCNSWILLVPRYPARFDG
jgi:hypothetical protein